MARPNFPLRVLVVSAAFLASRANAQLVSYNSNSPDQNDTARASFYRDVGVAGPEVRVDFETGFTDDQNISGQAGLLPKQLVIRDTATNGQAIIQQGPGSIETTGTFASPSNPVGQFALTHTPSGFSDLVFDFSSSPVDYVAFQDIDTDSNNSRIAFTFVGGGTFLFSLPDSTLSSGDSAEFLGFFRNDLPRITEMRLDFSGVTYGIDNLEYGVIPEPGTAVLAAIGAGVLAAKRRR